MESMFDLEAKVAIVTGGNGGIGGCSALRQKGEDMFRPLAVRDVRDHAGVEARAVAAHRAHADRHLYRMALAVAAVHLALERGHRVCDERPIGESPEAFRNSNSV